MREFRHKSDPCRNMNCTYIHYTTEKKRARKIGERERERDREREIERQRERERERKR